MCTGKEKNDPADDESGVVGGNVRRGGTPTPYSHSKLGFCGQGQKQCEGRPQRLWKLGLWIVADVFI